MKLKQISVKFNLLLPVVLFFSVVGTSLHIESVFAAECAGVSTAVLDCPKGVKLDPGENSGNTGNPDGDGIGALLFLVIQIMTAGVGIVAVGGLIYGGILYTSAGDSQEKVKKAIEVIRNVVIGIVAYFAMAAILNFLIPGGIIQ